jgi:hypothetical protein
VDSIDAWMKIVLLIAHCLVLPLNYELMLVDLQNSMKQET